MNERQTIIARAILDHLKDVDSGLDFFDAKSASQIEGTNVPADVLVYGMLYLENFAKAIDEALKRAEGTT